MTRARSSEPDGLPHDQAPLYYSQRATAGLIITEATNISPQAKGYSQTPSIFTSAQQERWKETADAVHATRTGARIFMQLWHVGRISAREVSGFPPVAPSPQRAAATVWVKRPNGWSGEIPCDDSRELSRDEIREIVREFATAARNAVDAGFDGVELHAANGYLIDQFLRTTTNAREDEYGGCTSGRTRFLREVFEAVAGEIGPSRVGIRLSPVVGFPDAQDSEIEDTVLAAAQWLDSERAAYLHIAEADGDWADAGVLTSHFRTELRRVFDGPIIVAHAYDVERAEAALASGLVDLVAFGRPFIANPDLVSRAEHGHPFAFADRKTYYGEASLEDAIVGYTDYPSWFESECATGRS